MNKSDVHASCNKRH